VLAGGHRAARGGQGQFVICWESRTSFSLESQCAGLAARKRISLENQLERDGISGERGRRSILRVYLTESLLKMNCACQERCSLLALMFGKEGRGPGLHGTFLGPRHLRRHCHLCLLHCLHTPLQAPSQEDKMRCCF